MAVICKPKKRKELDDIILQGKIEVDKSKPKNDMDDTDARLIDALGNLDKVVFFDKDGKTVSITPDTPLDGYRFSIKVNGKDDVEHTKTFEILKYETDPNGFAGAIIKDLGDLDNPNDDKNILWADGSKGLKHFFNSPKEVIKDWLVNDLWGIGRGEVFPQLESLYNFADKYMNPKDETPKIEINEAIGQSMMGVGMSALAFVDGFENIKFRTYSGCVQQELLDAIALRWGLNDKYGSNLESFFTPGEPLLNILQPVILNNKFYMKEFITNPCSKNPHSSDSYT